MKSYKDVTGEVLYSEYNYVIWQRACAKPIEKQIQTNIIDPQNYGQIKNLLIEYTIMAGEHNNSFVDLLTDSFAKSFIGYRLNSNSIKPEKS